MLLPNGCFGRPFQAKRCNNIDFGERGHTSFFAMSVTGWPFFSEEPSMKKLDVYYTKYWKFCCLFKELLKFGK